MNSIEEALNKRDMPGTIKMDLKYQKYFWFLMVIKLIISIKFFFFVYEKTCFQIFDRHSQRVNRIEQLYTIDQINYYEFKMS